MDTEDFIYDNNNVGQVQDRLSIVLRHLREEALRLVNRYRVGMGWPALDTFPKGRQCSSSYCPLARALRSNSVGGSIFVEDREAAIRVFATQPGDSNDSVVTPFVLLEFWRAHDHGFYPDLILESGDKELEQVV